MRLKISLDCEKSIVLPYGYMSKLQWLIYEFLDKLSSEWLHETGFKYEKRKFKLFTFSSFIQRPLKTDKKAKLFTFDKRVSFIIATPVDWIIKQLAQNLILSESFDLGRNKVKICGLEILPGHEIEDSKIRVNALTPIEVHSTFHTDADKKKTYYYAPTENEFSEQINENFKKKWEAFHNQICPYNIKISPVRSEFCRENIRKFKGTIIKGYSGHYFIEGEKKALEFFLESGAGSRNSGGFGFLEVVNKKDKQ